MRWGGDAGADAAVCSWAAARSCGAAEPAQPRPLAAALAEAVRERDAARDELRAAAAAKHDAQRRHASASLRAEQLEVHAAQLQQRLQSLAQQHGLALQQADCLQAELRAAVASQHAAQVQLDDLARENVALQQQRDELASMVQALQQSSAEREARVASRVSALEDTFARLRRSLTSSHLQCLRYDKELKCHWELRGIGAVEAAGRRALAQQQAAVGEQLRSEHYERGRIVTSEASSRHQLHYSLKYTGAAAKGSDRMPAHQALMVHTISHGVAVFAPEHWAPVCSSAARASLAVMQVHNLGWLAGEHMIGAFRSVGFFGYDRAAYGPEPGPLHSAWSEVSNLRIAMERDRRPGWRDPGLLCVDLRLNLYGEMQLRYEQLYLACRILEKKALRAAGRIHLALTMFSQRTEAD